ncbi:MAG: alpha/beta hydrolase [Acidobacteriota bacterium]
MSKPSHPPLAAPLRWLRGLILFSFAFVLGMLLARAAKAQSAEAATLVGASVRAPASAQTDAPDARDPALTFVSCHVAGITRAVRCGTLTVDEDGAPPADDALALSVIVVPALQPGARQPDPLVVLAGGPGQAATNYGPLVAVAFHRVNRTRDIVLMDQRGTGDGHALRCATSDWSDMAGTNPIDARACLAALNRDPRHYVSDRAIDDVEQLRRALGAAQINVWGGSFGTRLGLLYARRYPERVRMLVLDGSAPPELRFPLDNAAGAQRAWDLLRDDCAADPTCAAAHPDLDATFAALLTRLDAAPATVALRDPLTGAPITFVAERDGLPSVVRGALYVPEHAALVPQAVTRAADDGDFQLLINLMSETARWATDTMALGLTLTIICSEELTRTDPQTIDAHTRGTFLGRAEIDAWRTMCADWPRGSIAPELQAGAPLDAIPALLLSGDLDPVTPPAMGEAMATHLPNSQHVIVPGAGHGVSGLGCVPRLMAEALEAGVVDALDATCVDGIQRPPFVVVPQGAAP